jgi:two-component system, cell cycle sensor histidine kinase and response regulator CckA
MKEPQLLIPLIRRLVRSAVWALLALTITVAVMSFFAWRSSVWVRQGRRVQLTTQRALAAAVDRETAIRGFAVTGAAASLDPEFRARPRLRQSLESLHLLTAHDPEEHERVRQLAAAIAVWDSTYADPVLHASTSEERARLGAAHIAGRQSFDVVRARFEALLDDEAELYDVRVHHDILWRWGEAAIVAVEALLVVVVLLRLRRELLTQARLNEDQQTELEAQAVEQEALTAELEMANQELEEAAAEANQARDWALMLQERYQLLFERNPTPMWVYDRQTLGFLAANAAAQAQYGYTGEEFLHMTMADLQLARGDARDHGAQAHRRRDGSIVHVECVTNELQFDGRAATLVLAADVTERHRAEVELRDRDDMLRAAVHDSPLAIIVMTTELTITQWNPAATQMLGWSADEAIGTSFLRTIPPELYEEHEAMRRQLQVGEVVTNHETVRRGKNGEAIDVSVSLNSLRGADDAITGFVSLLSNVTERKRLESHFRQAQKMDAVGQLAGGVAHDFNNLLTVITSYSQMLLAELPPDSPACADVHEISRAAQRAALLTKQLLAFSRQQVLRPQLLALNTIVEGVERMLRRLVREDIAIVTKLEPELGTVEADPGQLEQILMNLVVNARDAMPNGGELRIETANVELDSEYTRRAADHALVPGPYVMIAVSDDGIGMSTEMQRHIFEPFFTTKPLGEGTGLGLPTVYGIVKQSGGHVAFYSEPGLGTTFKIYLPRVDAAPVKGAADHAPASPGSRGGETILVVEDDEALRRVACRALRETGYSVLEARHGSEALEICAREEPIDLVVTDMVMPEMSGDELDRRIAIQHPEIKILLMSGYTRDDVARKGIASEQVAFLDKPFTAARLAAKVREVLDGSTVRGAAR